MLEQERLKKIRLMEKNKMDGSDCPISVKEMRDDLLMDIFEEKIKLDCMCLWSSDQFAWYSLDDIRDEIFRRMSLSKE